MDRRETYFIVCNSPAIQKQTVIVVQWVDLNLYRNSSRNPAINPLTANLLVVYGTTFFSPTNPAIEEKATM